MKGILRVLMLMVMGGFVSVSAWSQVLCDSMDVILVQFADAEQRVFGEDSDLDGDGFGDALSLALIEAVVCVGPESDLNTVTEEGYLFNLEVFDAEEDAGEWSGYRELIATLMLIGFEGQVELNALLGDVLGGYYASVECVDGEVSAYAMEPPPPEETPDVMVRDSHEPVITYPYTATGDLDQDGTDNLTEYNNVNAQNGEMSDFIIAVTSPELDGNEGIRNPGQNSSGGGGGCFIATAAYGTPMAEEIGVLRAFRDEHLMGNAFGTVFVDSYYRVSPGIADLVAGSTMMREVVRTLLIPVLWIVEMPWILLCGLILAAVKRRVRLHA